MFISMCRVQGLKFLSHKFKAFPTKNSKKGIFNNFKKIGVKELSMWLTLIEIKIQSVPNAKCFWDWFTSMWFNSFSFQFSRLRITMQICLLPIGTHNVKKPCYWGTYHNFLAKTFKNTFCEFKVSQLHWKSLQYYSFVKIALFYFQIQGLYQM